MKVCDMTGAETVVKTLYRNGVRVVFGYPGGSVLPIYDRLMSSRIRHILPTHEQFACHAADGYARASGRTGVVLATSGPGATNLVTGIANAYMDSIPLVAITGNVPLSLLGHDAFQEIDIAGVTMPITKHNFIVKNPDELSSTLSRAFMIAESGRKGPVLVDIPSDILYAMVKPGGENILPKRHIQPDDAELERAAELINASERPFICVGGGVIWAEAGDEVKELAKRIGASVAVTAMGKGGYPSCDGHYVGMVGMRINSVTAAALRHSDLFIACGVRFSEKLMKNIMSYAPKAKILHFDIDAAEIGKNAAIYSRVLGDMKETLGRILPNVTPREYSLPTRKEVKKPMLYDALCRILPDAIYTTEVGLHQLDAAVWLDINTPRHFISSGGLGAMGFGLPAAIGAAVATGKRVVNIAGDGSFNMNISEIMTAVKYKLPIIQMICNNHCLGMIEKWQNDSFGGRLFETKTPSTDYCGVAAAMGAASFHAGNGSELQAALERAIKIKGPVVIDYEER